MVRRITVLFIMVAALIGGLSVTGQPASRFQVAHAAPTLSLRHYYIPISTGGTALSLPASATIIGCTDVSGSAIAISSGCMLLLSVNPTDATVTRTFRGQITGGSGDSKQYDGAVEHPVAFYFQRVGYTSTPYVILETN